MTGFTYHDEIFYKGFTVVVNRESDIAMTLARIKWEFNGRDCEFTTAGCSITMKYCGQLTGSAQTDLSKVLGDLICVKEIVWKESH
jgi:hypothetical protein